MGTHLMALVSSLTSVGQSPSMKGTGRQDDVGNGRDRHNGRSRLLMRSQHDVSPFKTVLASEVGDADIVYVVPVSRSLAPIES